MRLVDEVELVNAVHQFFNAVALTLTVVLVGLDLDSRVVDIELGLQHLGNLKECEFGWVLRYDVGCQNRLLGGDAPQVEVVHFIDYVKLKFFFKGGKTYLIDRVKNCDLIQLLWCAFHQNSKGISNHRDSSE